ncbi:hypothetical protein H2277_08460 [Campylobacter sp. W0014]|uniref:hypothetical protein n=1 Tax=Campylobacter sp. W0014 TaxID=2735781 RepID=UPI001ECAD83A|nr:hypothetical protein [Campylobacter sp. W0014]
MIKKYITIFIILLGFGCISASPISKQTTNQSIIYNDWFKRHGKWNFKKAYKANKAQGNKGYSFQTNWAILDMIAKDDVVGLKYMYEKLKPDPEHDMTFFNGIAVPSVSYEQQAIDKRSIKALKFLLKNKVIDIKATIEDEKTQKELSLFQYTTQKIEEAKNKKDFKAVSNYKKILEILQSYKEK